MSDLSKFYLDVTLEDNLKKIHQPVVSDNITVLEAAQFLVYLRGYCPFKRKNKSRSKAARIARMSEPGSSEEYVCSYSGAEPPCIFTRHKKEKIKYNCSARLIMKFPPGYEHDHTGHLNVYQFENTKINVTWHWQHSHPMLPIDYFLDDKLTSEMRDFVSQTVADGFGWEDFRQKIKDNSTKENEFFPLELLKLRQYHILWAKKNLMRKAAEKHVLPAESLKLWGEELKKDGMAEVSILHSEYAPERLFPDSGGYSWSLIFMTSSQREILKKRHEILYLDVTEVECRSINCYEEVYLHTLLSRDASTGKSCPVAFLLCNSIHDETAYFLEMVKSYAEVCPKIVCIDCEPEEKSAIEDVWPSASVITCRWFVSRAFRKHKVSSGTPVHESSDFQNSKKKAESDFTNAKLRESKDEGERSMECLLENFEGQAGVIDCLKSGWAKDLKMLESKNGFTSSVYTAFDYLYHLLQVKTKNKERLDVFIYKLVKNVLPVYLAREDKVAIVQNPAPLKVIDSKKVADFYKAKIGSIDHSITALGDDKYLVNTFSCDTKSSKVDLRVRDECTCPVGVSRRYICRHVIVARDWSRFRPQPTKKPAATKKRVLLSEGALKELVSAQKWKKSTGEMNSPIVIAHDDSLKHSEDKSYTLTPHVSSPKNKISAVHKKSSVVPQMDPNVSISKKSTLNSSLNVQSLDPNSDNTAISVAQPTIAQNVGSGLPCKQIPHSITPQSQCLSAGVNYGIHGGPNVPCGPLCKSGVAYRVNPITGARAAGQPRVVQPNPRFPSQLVSEFIALHPQFSSQLVSQYIASNQVGIEQSRPPNQFTPPSQFGKPYQYVQSNQFGSSQCFGVPSQFGPLAQSGQLSHFSVPSKAAVPSPASTFNMSHQIVPASQLGFPTQPPNLHQKNTFEYSHHLQGAGPLQPVCNDVLNGAVDGSSSVSSDTSTHATPPQVNNYSRSHQKVKSGVGEENIPSELV